jgi:hypothetical protein
MATTPIYDLIIVGGGIAGLRVGIEALKQNPFIHCCILEKYNYIGGRIVTFRKTIPRVGEVQWENGAGRISTTHSKVLSLLSRYNLTFIPISDETDYINDPTIGTVGRPIMTGNTFTDLIKVYLDPLAQLSHDILERHTLAELLDKTLGSGAAGRFYEQFPYWSEIHTLRADLGLQAFKGEMNSNKGFGVCKEGLSSLIDKMKAEFLERGGSIMIDTELYSISAYPDRSMHLSCRVRNTKKTIALIGSACVLALHHAALKNISGVSQLKVLKHLTMEPLLRMYAIFPVRRGTWWGKGLNKVVTNSPIRYIIPIDSERGIVMISYTDGADARHWIKQDESAKEHGEENVKDLVMTEIRRLFPDRHIPNPIFFKQHPWYEGCTYWRPGKYDVKEESRRSLHPLPGQMPNLFMCGESFAVKQCWMESALDQADDLLMHPKFRDIMRRL